jgi:hypothetical protein
MSIQIDTSLDKNTSGKAHAGLVSDLTVSDRIVLFTTWAILIAIYVGFLTIGSKPGLTKSSRMNADVQKLMRPDRFSHPGVLLGVLVLITLLEGLTSTSKVIGRFILTMLRICKIRGSSLEKVILHLQNPLTGESPVDHVVIFFTGVVMWVYLLYMVRRTGSIPNSPILPFAATLFLWELIWSQGKYRLLVGASAVVFLVLCWLGPPASGIQSMSFTRPFEVVSVAGNVFLQLLPIALDDRIGGR